jgi:SH3-like domain-containing protein
MKRFLIIVTVLLGFFSSVVNAERLSVAVPQANIRSGPGTKYDKMWEVWKYYPINIVKKTGSWYYFRDFEGDEGWIHKSLLKKIPTVITTKKKCNIRSGPSIKQKIVFTVGKGISFRIIKRKGNWLHVEHADGDKGWIHKSLVW